MPKLNPEDILPHRYPFLLVDDIEEINPGKSAVGYKNFSRNEWFFQGHFPGYPVAPGVLIVEALAQMGAVALLSVEENKGKLAMFAGIDEFRFRKEVLPGNRVRLQVTIERVRGPVGKGHGVASVNGEVAAEGKLLFALKDSDRFD